MITTPRIERAVREQSGYWRGWKTKPLEEKAVPHFLRKPAKGQFPKIEKELWSKHHCQIPKEWTIAETLSGLALGSALLTESDHVYFPPQKRKPRIALIIDDCQPDSVKYGLLSYMVIVNHKTYRGTLYTPQQSDQNRSGFPWITARYGQTTQGLTAKDFIEGRKLTQRGSQLVGFMAQLIKKDGLLTFTNIEQPIC